MGRTLVSVPVRFLAAAFMLVSVAAACGRPTAVTEEIKSATKTPVAPALSPWEELVKEGQKEGTVNIYAGDLGPAAPALRESFIKKYGIELEFVVGRPSETQARFLAERKAGLYLADVCHLGETSTQMDVKPLGITIPLTNMLVLPEVKDPKNWIGNRIPFLDQEQQVFMFMGSAMPQAVVNTDMVKENDIISFADLLNPRWKGKIAFSDPTISGGAPNVLAALAKTLGKEKALEMFRQLAAQEPVISRDKRLLIEWAARGKYPVSLAVGGVEYGVFRKAGAPIRALSFKEPRHIFGGPGTISVFSHNPHPKATQVYINWLLTKDGSAVFSRAADYASMRTDVGKDWLDPDTIPRPDDVFPDEEQLRLRLEMRDLSAQIFGIKK